MLFCFLILQNVVTKLLKTSDITSDINPLCTLSLNHPSLNLQHVDIDWKPPVSTYQLVTVCIMDEGKQLDCQSLVSLCINLERETPCVNYVD